jgi:hypothetical protein
MSHFFLTFIIFNIHLYSTIIHSFILHHLPWPVFLYLHRFSDQQEKPPWGANPRIELRPAIQQADALPIEPCHTLIEPNQSLIEPRHTLIEPHCTLIEPSHTLTEPCCILIEPCRTLIEPCRTLIEPGRTLIEPCRTLIEPGRTLIEPGRTMIEPRRNLDGVYLNRAECKAVCRLHLIILN